MLTLYRPDPGYEARGWRIALVHIVSGKQTHFKKGGAGIEQFVDSISGQELATTEMSFAGVLTTALHGQFCSGAHDVPGFTHGSGIFFEAVGSCGDSRFDNGHEKVGALNGFFKKFAAD
jgi:hypothetical protein